MKLGSVTKRDRRNIAIPKKFHDDFISANFDVIFPFLWPITFPLIVTFYFTETENKNRKCLTQISSYRFE